MVYTSHKTFGSNHAWTFRGALILLTMAACSSPPTKRVALDSGSPSTSLSAEKELHITQAIFAKGLTPNQEAAQPVPADAGGKASFDTSAEKICISLSLVSLPNKGRLLFEVLQQNEPQAKAVLVDFANVPQPVREKPSVWLGAFWEPEARVISENYSFLFYYQVDEHSPQKLLGTYGFRIVPPTDAIPSHIESVVVAAGETDAHDAVPAPVAFALDQPVYLVLRGDLGKGSRLGFQWDRGGPKMSFSVPVVKNQKDNKFSVYFLPDGGWSPGSHQVTVFLNDKIVGRYSFAVKNNPSPRL